LSEEHHYNIVGVALGCFEERLHGPQREEMLALLKNELRKPDMGEQAE
jgi:hypothetical protein